MRPGPSPRFSCPARRRDDSPAGTSLWDRQGGSGVYMSHMNNNNNNSGGGGGMYGTKTAARVSDMLHPRVVNDMGLQRALNRAKTKRRSLPSRNSDDDNDGGGGGLREGGWKREEDARVRDFAASSSSSFHGYEKRTGGSKSSSRVVAASNKNEVHEYNNGGVQREWERYPQSHGERLHSSRPLVDVVAAFGGAAGGSSPDSSGRSISTSMRNKATASVSSLSSSSLLLLLSVAPRVGIDVADAARTTTPHVYIEQPSAEPTTQERYRGWKPSPSEKESVLTGYSWSPVHGTNTFSAINSNVSHGGTGGVGQYNNPNAEAERILHMLLRQNEELTTVSPSSFPVRRRSGGGGAMRGESTPRSSRHADSATTQQRPAIRVTPQERRVVLNLVREKDREILQLRSSLAISYRHAAASLHRLYTSGTSRGALSQMEGRFLDALASAVKRKEEKERDAAKALLLVNRAPPHIHGLPNVPLPLGLPCSVGQVCGVLSMLNVEEMTTMMKKNEITTRRFLTRSWLTYFVVADDRGLSVYRSEEDYKQHAFQRALMVVPFRDMEYFVPSFRKLPICEDELIDVTATAGAAAAELSSSSVHSRRQKEREEEAPSGGRRFFPPFVKKRNKHKREKRMNSVQSAEGSGDYGNNNINNNNNNDGNVYMHSRCRPYDRYDELMAQIAVEYTCDTSHAYFGFIPKQPGTMSGGKVVNPPILFRTASAQEHMEWAHYLAQCFNRKLYREMFPTALAETYIGTVSKKTQTEKIDGMENKSLEQLHELKEEGEKEEKKRHEEEKKEKNEENRMKPTYSSKEVMAVACSVDAGVQTTLHPQKDEATSTEEVQEKENNKDGTRVSSARTIPQPPPPLSSPPRDNVIEPEETPESIYQVVVEEEEEKEKSISHTELREDDRAGNKTVSDDRRVPWKELLAEMRELRDTKNTERDELQRECEELRLRVRKLLLELQELNNKRSGLHSEVKEVRAMHDAEVQRLQEIISREKEERDRDCRLHEEMMKSMRHEQELLTAELLAVKDGYSDGLRSLARKALGDINMLHDVCTAGEYLSALRGGRDGIINNEPREEDDESACMEDEANISSGGSNRSHTLSPQRQEVQHPRVPPPKTSLRQPFFLSHGEQNKRSTNGNEKKVKKTYDPMHPLRDVNNSRVQEARKHTSAGSLGVAMLLISFTPQHMSIDGSFTVDESQARLLRSGPSATKRGREWVMFHHDTRAVFVVTAELHVDRETTPSTSPPRRALGSTTSAVKNKKKNNNIIINARGRV